MGNYFFGNNPRSGSDIELQSDATDPKYMLRDCNCVQTPGADCLHRAIRERKLEYVSST